MNAGERDLIVVGGGVAGWVTARRAQQLGLAVTLVERADEPCGGGNTRLSSGWFHAAYRRPDTDPETLYETIVESTEATARIDVARAWANNVGRAFRFLVSEGAEFAPLNDHALEYQQNVIQPKRADTLERAWQDAGPDRLLRTMAARFVEEGGELLLSTRARRLLRDEKGRVRGVAADREGARVDLHARSVVLADGGFQSSPELVHQYITAAYKLRGGDGDTGDALRMGLEVGAAIHSMRAFYGHCLTRDSLEDDRLWPAPSPHPLIETGIVVDGSGERFIDEGRGNHDVAGAVAASPTPGDCWVIFGDEAWRTVATEGSIPANPTLVECGATVLEASDPRELARLAGLPEEAVARSVESVGAFADSGSPVEPPRTGTILPLTSLPLRAIPLVAGITFTMGGLLVDGLARVLDVEGAPIDGLLAAGGSMGGLQGGPNSGYAGGWSEATTFGVLAAETAYESVRAHA